MTGRKLSKRYVESSQSFLIKDYKADGVLPEALINWVALFGWSPKTESDVHSKDDLINRVA
jgi:glutamyl/glutaminyl-tRNA synthetase